MLSEHFDGLRQAGSYIPDIDNSVHAARRQISPITGPCNLSYICWVPAQSQNSFPLLLIVLAKILSLTLLPDYENSVIRARGKLLSLRISADTIDGTLMEGQAGKFVVRERLGRKDTVDAPDDNRWVDTSCYESL